MYRPERETGHTKTLIPSQVEPTRHCDEPVNAILDGSRA